MMDFDVYWVTYESSCHYGYVADRAGFHPGLPLKRRTGSIKCSPYPLIYILSDSDGLIYFYAFKEEGS